MEENNGKERQSMTRKGLAGVRWNAKIPSCRYACACLPCLPIVHCWVVQTEMLSSVQSWSEIQQQVTEIESLK